MRNNIFKSKEESGIKTSDPIEKRLPQLYKILEKLMQKADPYNHELSSSQNEFSKFLGYKDHEIKSILEDLARFNLISLERNEERDQYKIKSLVH